METKKEFNQLTTEQLKTIIDYTKKLYYFFPEYTITYKCTNNKALITSNSLEVLEYIQRYTGGKIENHQLTVQILK